MRLLEPLRWRRRAGRQPRPDIRVGSAVVTTSGLHATVTALNPDGSAVIAITADVHVRWATAALRVEPTAPGDER